MTKKYSITPEHRIELENIKQKYIQNARRTDPMTEYDKAQMRLAMRGIYKNAGLPYVGDDKIIFVKSPLIAQCAAGIAMAMIHNNAAEEAAEAAWAEVEEAVVAAARSAAREAAVAAAEAEAVAAARSAAEAAEAAVTAAGAAGEAVVAAEDATAVAAASVAVAVVAALAAVESAVVAAAGAAEAAGEAARSAVDAAEAAEESTATAKHPNENSLDKYIKAMTDRVKNYGNYALFSVYYAWRYGARSAMWPWYQVYGDFFKNVAKLEGDWEKWDPINLDALHGGVRYTTKDFTIIADRPETLKIDEQGRLHNETGPAVKWRDGMEQYYWHGLSIPDWWIRNKKDLSPQIALSQENAELRRCACEILGWANILSHPSLNPKVIDEDAPHIGTIYQVDLPEAPAQWFIKYQCGTGRWFAEAVNDKRYNTALKANAAKRGWRPEFESPPEHFIPFIRT